MVQLQLLDLMIPKECGAVPMDAATRADLIDLMARVLVVVFHEEGGSVNDQGQDVEFLSLARERGSACRRGYGVLRTGKAAPHLRFAKKGVAASARIELADASQLTSF